MINKANQLNKASYNEKSWLRLEKALMEAKIVLEDPEASEAQIRKIEMHLNEALMGLETIEATSDLKKSNNMIKKGDRKGAVNTGDEENIRLTGAILLFTISVIGILIIKRKKEV